MNELTRDLTQTLTADEQRYLLALLKNAQTQLLNELHHTDSREFQQGLRREIATNETLIAKLAAQQAA
jgi:hypothetical protein